MAMGGPAAHNRSTAVANSALAGQAVANAILIRRTLNVTTAPIFRS